MILLFSPFHCDTRKLRQSEETTWACRLSYEPKSLAPDLPLDSGIKAAWTLQKLPRWPAMRLRATCSVPTIYAGPPVNASTVRITVPTQP